MAKTLVHEIDSFCKVNCSHDISAMIDVDNFLWCHRFEETVPPSKIILTRWTFFSFRHYRRPDNFAAQQMWLWNGSLRLVLRGHGVEMGKVTCPTKAAIFSKIFAFLSKYLPRSNKVFAKYCRYQNIREQNTCLFTKYLSPYQIICLSIQIFPGRQKESRRNGIRAGTRAWSRYGPNKYFSESVYEWNCLPLLLSKYIDDHDRLEICRDRRDRRSCKIFVSCVNFPRKQRSFLHILQV